LAIITGGEGWHNNHHHYQSSTRQGFYWWEVDFNYYFLKVLSWFRLVKGLKKPPKDILRLNLVKDGHFDIGIFQVRLKKALNVINDRKDKGGLYYGNKKRDMEVFLEQTKYQADELISVTKKSARDLTKYANSAINARTH
jgi:hypothetical protein